MDAESAKVVSDSTRKRSLVAMLIVLSGAGFLEGLDVSMMGVALPSIRAEFGMSTSSLQWVISAYVLGFGGFVLLGGRAADLLGRRRMFLLWLGVFIAFSGLGGLAGEGWMLIVARFVTGVAAGFLAPAGLSLLTTNFAEGAKRNRALAVYAGAAAAGFSLGLVAGGLLTGIDWRWVFFGPVVAASVLFVAALRVIPDDGRGAFDARRFDLGGALTITLGMLALVFGVVRAPNVAWWETVAAFAASAALIATFVSIERRAPEPLVRLGILRSGALVRANLAAILFVGAFVSFQFVVVLYMQELRGWSPVETGLALLIVGSDSVLSPLLAPKLMERFGGVRVIMAGSLLAAFAYALFLPLSPDWSYAVMLPTMILIGIAFALAYAALTVAATDGVADEEQGLAGGLLSVSFQFGAALGIAVVAAVQIAATGEGGGEAALMDGYRAGLMVPVAAALLGAAITAYGLRRREPAIAVAPPRAAELGA